MFPTSFRENASEDKIKQLIRNKEIDDDDRSKLKKYLRQKCGPNTFSVHYEQSGRISGYGRYYVKNDVGLQGFKKEIRNYISNDFYSDVDIVNCNPVILKHFFNEYSLVCNELNQYIDNRADILKKYKFSKDDMFVMMFDVNFSSANIFLNKIHKFIYETSLPVFKDRHPDLWKIAKKSRKKDVKENREGSFIATVIQDFENKIIQEAFNILRREGHDPDALMFDGMLVKKPFEDVDLLNKSFSKYGIEFVIKPMTKVIEVTEATKSKKYLEWKEDWETRHCVIKFTSNQMNIFSFINDKINIHNVKDFVDKASKTKFDLSYDEDMFNIWYHDDKHKRQYEDIDFIPPPATIPDDIFNLWTGFHYNNVEIEENEEYKTEVLTTFDKFMDHFSSGDIKVKEYLIQYIAHMIQKPGEKPGVAIACNGEQGAGKGTIYNICRNLMRSKKDHGGMQYVVEISSADRVFGRFNDILEGKIMIALDEIDAIKTVAAANTLKNYITEEYIDIESKGMRSRHIHSFMRIFIFSNEENIVKIKNDKERRYLIMEVLKMPEDLLDKIYYGDYKLDSYEGYYYLFQYLKNYKITVKNWQKEKPITQAYKDIKEHFEDNHITFLKDFIGNHDSYSDKPLPSELKLKNKDLYEEYVVFISKYMSNHHPLNVIDFGRKLSKVKGINKDTHSNTIINVSVIKKTLDIDLFND